MSEFTVVLKNLQNKGYGLTVSKCDSFKGGLIITKITEKSPAYEKDLKVDDYISRVNNKSSKNNRSKLVSDINGSKSESITLEIQRNKQDFHHRSDNNLSSSISSMKNNSQTFRSSKSSIDLNSSCQAPKQILNSNYIPEDQLKNYIQDDSSNVYGTFCEDSNLFYNPSTDRSLISLDDSDSIPGSRKHSTCVSPVPPIQPTPQVTMKQAYKKSIDESDNIYQAQAPRINRKKATHSVNISNKDPVVQFKKKIVNSDISPQISRNVSTIHQPKRYTSTPISKFNNSNGVLQNDNSLSSSQPSPSINDSEDGLLLSKPKRSPNLAKDTPPIKEVLLTRTMVESEMKITSFKDNKIIKPNWKKYWLESDFSGVNFECSDFSQIQPSSNSTALNPSIASPDLIMNVWHMNNSITKFYLPLYQSQYDSQITRSILNDEIKVTFPFHKVEFSIKLNEDNTSKLCDMLKVNPPELKPPAQIKHKKSIGSVDSVRPEPKKMKQPQKPVLEKLILSALPKTTKVEGIPLMVVICTTLIEEIGLKEEGIYRKSGNLPGKRVLDDIIINESPEKWSSHEEWTNVNTVSNLFKGFLRKYTLLDKDTAIKLSTVKLSIEDFNKNECDNKQIQEIMDMIYHLTSNFKSISFQEESKCRLDTFKYIIKHLYRVSLCHEYTKMNSENLAKIFVPNLIEDIPLDDEVQYKESRSNVAHEHLTKIVTFWITYADSVCEMLEEDKPEELSKMVVNFLNQKHLPNKGNITIADKEKIVDLSKLVKERIDFYTEDLCLDTSTTSLSPPLNVNTPDNYFARTRNSRNYQSLKQPRNVKSRRRNNSGSSMDMLKPVIVVSSNQENESKSPTIFKKTVFGETWSSKNLKKPKELPLGNPLNIKMSSLSIAGNKKDVPLVVAVCIDIVEKFGLKIDGIYRISGRNQDINTLDALVMDNDIDKWKVDSNIKIWANLHNTACLLKKVLKKFCLIPKDTWMHMSSQFSEKLEAQDVKNVLKAAAYYLRTEIPKPNMYHSTGKINFEDKSDMKQCETRFRSGTLRYVLKHLRHISRHESDNRMTSNALAVCFVPVLMEEDYSTDMMVTNTKCIQIVQLLIDHCVWIFQWDFRPSVDLYGQTMSDSLDKYLNEYHHVSCYNDHSENTNFVVDNDDVKGILDRLIQSSYLCEEFASNNLVTYFESNNDYPSLSTPQKFE